jgi:hypothetical protein
MQSFYTRLVLFLHILCVPSRSKLHILELCYFFRRVFHILHTEIWPGQDLKKETINENFQMWITIVSWHEHRSIYKVMQYRKRVIHCNRLMLYLTSLLILGSDCREKMSRISSEVSILRGKYFSESFYTRLVLFLHILCVPSRSKLHILELCATAEVWEVNQNDKNF